MRSQGEQKPERYSSGGVVVGVIGIIAVAATLVGGTIDENSGFPTWGYPAGVLIVVAIWAVMLRPAVVLSDDEVELRNVLHSDFIPYAQIIGADVAQITAIRTEERKYVGSGFGRTRRAMNRDHVVAAKVGTAQAPSRGPSLGQLVEDKIERRAKAAREVQTEAPGVRRSWAWLEIAAAAVAALATVVLAVVG